MSDMSSEESLHRRVWVSSSAKARRVVLGLDDGCSLEGAHVDVQTSSDFLMV